MIHLTLYHIKPSDAELFVSIFHYFKLELLTEFPAFKELRPKGINKQTNYL